MNRPGFDAMEIRATTDDDFDDMYEIVNDAAQAYRGIIPADRWHDPYMPREELRSEIDDGIHFFGCRRGTELLGIMGIQDRGPVVLVRHAYIRTAHRRAGIGSRLLEYLESTTKKTILIGTWLDAVWAIRFYEKNGFVPIDDIPLKNAMLRRFWHIPERQVETSTVLTNNLEFCKRL